jgi:hypothetical protein
MQKNPTLLNKKSKPDSPAPDMKRALSGHPQDLAVKAPAAVPAPWLGGFSSTLTAWSGPWA